MAPSLQYVTDQFSDLAALCDQAGADPAGWDFFELKTQLNARFGAAATHQLFGEFLQRFGPLLAVHRPMLHLDQVAADQAFAMHHQCRATEVTLNGAPLPGGHRSPKTKINARGLFVAGLHNVTTYGRSNLRKIGDRVFSDIQGNEAGRYPTQWWFDPMVAGKDDDGYYLHLPSEPQIQLSEAIDLTGVFSFGWGHCLLEISPQLLMAEILANVAPDVPLLVDENLPQACYDMFHYVSGKNRPMIKLGFRQAAQVDRLWAASSPEYWPALRAPGTEFEARLTSINPSALAHLVAKAPDAAAFHTSGPRNKRYFFARSGRDQRFQNQDAAMAQFKKAGFEVFHPERHSFAEQFSAVQQASHIAGPWGSQLLLPLMYGPPSLRVLIFHQPNLEERPGITQIAEERGQTLLLLPGICEKYNKELPYNSLYSVPEKQITSALNDWL